jgi:hypothetical protein
MGEKNRLETKAPDRDDDLTYSLTFKDVVDILEVIDSSDGKELSLEVGDLKLNLIKR